MPRAFEITAPVTTLTVPASAKAEVTFAVTSQLDHAAKVRATIVPEGATKKEWLSLAEAVKDVNVKQTETFTVRVLVPAGTALGDYPFKIVAASEDNPEEEATESPTVQVHVKYKRDHHWWRWIAIAVVAAAVLGAGGYAIYKLACQPPPKPTPGTPCTDDNRCAPNQKCIEIAPGSRACLLRPDQPCDKDLDCSSFWCREDKHVCSKDDGSCVGDADCRGDAFLCTNQQCLKKIGQPCKESGECTTGNCASQICRPAVSVCQPACRFPMRCVDGSCKQILLRPGMFRLIPKQRLTPVPPKHL